MHIQYKKIWSDDIQERRIINGTLEQYKEMLTRMKYDENIYDVKLIY